MLILPSLDKIKIAIKMIIFIQQQKKTMAINGSKVNFCSDN